MSDAIVNARNLNTNFYSTNKIGPRLRVFRESDFNFLIDECEKLCDEQNSPFNDKQLKSGKAVIVKFILEKTHAEMLEGVTVSWAHSQKALAMFESIGVRALRDYKYLTILFEVLRAHHAESRGEIITNEI